MILLEELDFRAAYLATKACHGKARPWHHESYKAAGVYFIKEDGKLVYIGIGKTNVIKSLYRHFQRWNDWKYDGTQFRKRVTYIDLLSLYTYTVAMVVFPSAPEAEEAEKELIIRYNPRDNATKYQTLQEQKKYEPLTINDGSIWKPIPGGDYF